MTTILPMSNLTFTAAIISASAFGAPLRSAEFLAAVGWVVWYSEDTKLRCEAFCCQRIYKAKSFFFSQYTFLPCIAGGDTLISSSNGILLPPTRVEVPRRLRLLFELIPVVQGRLLSSLDNGGVNFSPFFTTHCKIKISW